MLIGLYKRTLISREQSVDNAELVAFVQTKNRAGKRAYDLAVEVQGEESVRVLEPLTLCTQALSIRKAPICVAASGRDPWSIEALARIRQCGTSGGYDHLHRAISQVNLPAIRDLLAAGAKVNLKYRYGSYTPLDDAVLTCDCEVVRTLIDAEADVNQLDDWGRTALHLAIEQNCPCIVECLIPYTDLDQQCHLRRFDHQDYLNLRRLNQQYYLHYAASGLHTDKIVRLLLTAGMHVDSKDNYGQTPLYVAAGYGSEEIVNILLSAGADPNQQGVGGRTPLHEAAKKGSLEIVEALLRAGADVNARDKEGKTPMDYAEQNSHMEVVNVLAQKIVKD